PWIRRVEREVVPAPRSSRSIRATCKPRSAASRAIPQPTIPPPTTSRSMLVEVSSCSPARFILPRPAVLTQRARTEHQHGPRHAGPRGHRWPPPESSPLPRRFGGIAAQDRRRVASSVLDVMAGGTSVEWLRGKLIAIEGIDQAGKQTICEWLVRDLASR